MTWALQSETSLAAFLPPNLEVRVSFELIGGCGWDFAGSKACASQVPQRDSKGHLCSSASGRACRELRRVLRILSQFSVAVFLLLSVPGARAEDSRGSEHRAKANFIKWPDGAFSFPHVPFCSASLETFHSVQHRRRRLEVPIFPAATWRFCWSHIEQELRGS